MTTKRRSSKPLRGELSISYPCGGAREDVCSISLRDAKSGVVFVEVEISMLEMMRAMACHHGRPCEFTFRGVENVGKTMEMQTHFYEKPPGMYARGEERKFLEKATKEHAVDGWQPEIEAALSTKQSPGVLRVLFRRYV